jgi:MoaA/NifB/PqqE/SkfB family radical SAM enzyme
MHAPASSVARTEDNLCCYRNINSAGMRVAWEITARCNLECPYCFATKHIGDELTTAEALLAMESMKEGGVKKLMISGGEPFLRKDAIDLIEHGCRTGLLMKIITNGTALSSAVIGRLKDLPVEISFSLDGAHAETHDHSRRKAGSFDRILATIAKLDSLPFDIICVVTKENWREAGELIDLAHAIKCRSITFTSLISFSHSNLTPDEEAKLFDLLAERRARYGSAFAIRTVAFRQSAASETCMAGRSIFFICSEGYVHSCSLLKHVKDEQFNIRRRPFGEIAMSLREMPHHLRAAASGPAPRCHKLTPQSAAG